MIGTTTYVLALSFGFYRPCEGDFAPVCADVVGELFFGGKKPPVIRLRVRRSWWFGYRRLELSQSRVAGWRSTLVPAAVRRLVRDNLWPPGAMTCVVYVKARAVR